MSSAANRILLVICDGWGEAPPSEANAITRARTPTFDRWREDFPHTILEASGEAVGLPEGVMGNSEVGHLNLGAGRMVPQDLLRVDLALRDGTFFENPVLTGAVDRARDSGAALHLMGLVSDGGVHSHESHLFGLLELARRRRQPRVHVHAFTDGRDTPPRSALGYLERLEAKLRATGGDVATVSGRYFAMDRDGRWDRVALAWEALRFGRGRRTAGALAAVQEAYARGESDEFIVPTVIEGGDGEPVGPVADGDSVIFFNFRADRARQLTRAFTEADFTEFSRGRQPSVHFVCFTEYKKEFDLPVAFPSPRLDEILAAVWADAGVRNLRLAETEKYAHVTYFFNGGVEEPYPGEERILVSSWKGATYDLHPEMSAGEITDQAIRAMSRTDGLGAIVLNYANADMVGHTGKLPETITAVETLDRCFEKLAGAARENGWLLIMTADHGNAEMMIDPSTGEPHTAHTTNPVPIVVGRAGGPLRRGGSLGDVAPTVLSLQGIPVPKEMTGRDLRLQEPGGGRQPS